MRHGVEFHQINMITEGLKLQSAAFKASLPGSAAPSGCLFGKTRKQGQGRALLRVLVHLEQVSELASALRSSREEVAAQVAAATAKDRENSQLWEQVGIPSPYNASSTFQGQIHCISEDVGQEGCFRKAS